MAASWFSLIDIARHHAAAGCFSTEKGWRLLASSSQIARATFSLAFCHWYFSHSRISGVQMFLHCIFHHRRLLLLCFQLSHDFQPAAEPATSYASRGVSHFYFYSQAAFIHFRHIDTLFSGFCFHLALHRHGHFRIIETLLAFGWSVSLLPLLLR